MAGAGSHGSRSSQRSASRRSSAVLATVRPLVEELADAYDVEVWDVEFVHEAGRETLRVSLDREGGIVSDELQEVAEELSQRLDETEAVPGEKRYWLEVTSPGAERKLHTPREFRICRGRLARVTFRDGREPVIGEIGEVTDESVELRPAEDGPLSVAYDEISQARLRVPGV